MSRELHALAKNDPLAFAFDHFELHKRPGTATLAIRRF
jgi:hypothetical protein